MCCDMLSVVGSNSLCNICGCCMIMWSLVQVRTTMMQVGMRTSSIFKTQYPNACIMLLPTLLRYVVLPGLCWNVAIVWPELANAGRTKCNMLCPDLSVRVDMLDMLRSFGRGFSYLSSHAVVLQRIEKSRLCPMEWLLSWVKGRSSIRKRPSDREQRKLFSHACDQASLRFFRGREKKGDAWSQIKGKKGSYSAHTKGQKI